jgi:hypothetical protein
MEKLVARRASYTEMEITGAATAMLYKCIIESLQTLAHYCVQLRRAEIVELNKLWDRFTSIVNKHCNWQDCKNSWLQLHNF